MVVIYPEDVWYGQVTPDKVNRIVEEHLAGGRVAADLVYSAPPGAHKNPARMAEIQKARAAAPPPSPKTGEPR
jgi:(2Fe-2S) ferredoxin